MNNLVSLWRGPLSRQSQAMKQEIDEELRLHLELRTAETRGWQSAEEAAHAARRRFGNVPSVREDCAISAARFR